MNAKLTQSILLATACFAATQATAANRDDAWVISAMGGIYAFDEDRGLAFVNDEPKNGPTGTLALGYNFTDAFGIEGAVTFFTIEPENGNVDYDGQQYRIDALYHFNADKKFVPYVVGGAAHQVINGTVWGDATELLLNAGFGAKFFLTENVAFRADARAVSAEDYDYSEAMYNFGISYLVGGKPNKPADADNDGVPDTADKCASTMPGIQVDAEGCALDTDKDGVPNQNDSCPGTTAGATVDEKGCPVDSDNDGIPDTSDKCPNTPVGADINAAGCPIDTDKDGIADYADKCENTPAGAKIDADGCRIKLSETVELSMQIEFNSGSGELKQEHFNEIKRVADFMTQYPDSEVVIEGHTDSTGARNYNLSLSQKRADSVRNRLVAFYGIKGSRVTAVGYGPDRPVADNRTQEGRQQNRRVIAVVKAVVEK